MAVPVEELHAEGPDVEGLNAEGLDVEGLQVTVEDVGTTIKGWSLELTFCSSFDSKE